MRQSCGARTSGWRTGNFLLPPQQILIYTLLGTPSGPALWRHAVMLFGASSSAWCFNRCIDALAHLARVLLLVVAIHFVDDIGCPDADFSAESSFSSFDSLRDVLGMKLKPSKAQGPATAHEILGVIIEVCDKRVLLRPDAGRVSKVLAIITSALQEDELDSDTELKASSFRSHGARLGLEKLAALQSLSE